MKKFEAMSREERFEFMATANRVTVGHIEQIVIEDGKKTIKRFYVAKVRGIIVSDKGKYKFANKSAARQFGYGILAGWQKEYTRQPSTASNTEHTAPFSITHRVTLTANTDPNDPKYQLLTLRLTTGETYTCAIEHSMCLDETAKALKDAADWLLEKM